MTKRLAWLSAVATLELAGCSSVGSGPGASAPTELAPRCAAGIASPPALLLERALPIDCSCDDLEPSGLALRDGRLLTVSDKHDDTIFELVTGPAAAAARPSSRFRPPEPPVSPLDLEGIVAEPGGSWLLASEGADSVLRVSADGTSRWLWPSHRDVGRAAGLFRTPGAGTEALAVLPDGTLLLAAEREPRGLIEIPPAGPVTAARAFLLPPGCWAAPPGRADDLTDLTVWRGQVYGLQRNAHLVVRWERGPEGWREGGAWSYARAENDPRFAYRDRRFGLAEGLAIDDHHVYVILDNNHDARQAAPDDRRPLLLVFRNELRPTR